MRTWIRISRDVACLVALAGLLGCTAGPTASQLASPTAGPSVAVATPSRIPGPTATPPPAPTPVPTQRVVPAADLRWEELSNIPDGRVDGLVGFSGGYVAYGASGPELRPVAWFSVDGRDWRLIELAGLVPCADASLTSAGYVTAGASGGDRVVLVGARSPGGGRPCGDTWPAAWVISDELGLRFAEPPTGWQAMNGQANGVWATPVGWETFVETDLRPALWQSVDGLAWLGPSSAVDPGGEATFFAAGSDPNGVRVMAVRTRPTGDEQVEQLLESVDGVSWSALDRDPSQEATIHRIVPPSAGASWPWVLVTSREGESAATSTSHDRRQWTSSPFPMPAVADLAATGYGLLATGLVPCLDQGGTCPDEDRTQFLSADGAHWTELGASVPAAFVAEGPAGVIGVGRSNAEGSTTVWRLLDATGTP